MWLVKIQTRRPTAALQPWPEDHSMGRIALVILACFAPGACAESGGLVWTRPMGPRMRIEGGRVVKIRFCEVFYRCSTSDAISGSVNLQAPRKARRKRPVLQNPLSLPPLFADPARAFHAACSLRSGRPESTSNGHTRTAPSDPSSSPQFLAAGTAGEIESVSYASGRTAVNGPGPEWAPTSSKHGPLNQDLSGSTSPGVTDNQSAIGGLTERTNLRAATVPGVTDNQSAIGGLTEGTNLGVGREGQAN